MNELLLHFMMFYLLKVSFAKMAVCKTVRSGNELEDNPQSFIFIENDNLKKEQKGNNKTKGEKGEIGKKGEKGDVGQINQTEINQLKQRVTGWAVLNLK